MNIWAVQWHSHNRISGDYRHICLEHCLPVLFKTRRKAREYITEKYGYIAGRPDLKGEPHGWRMPQAIKVKIVPLELLVPDALMDDIFWVDERAKLRQEFPQTRRCE